MIQSQDYFPKSYFLKPASIFNIKYSLVISECLLYINGLYNKYLLVYYNDFSINTKAACLYEEA